ncbi:MAG: hypothetical protein AAFV62_12385 [Pseudomonadota bacterium]
MAVVLPHLSNRAEAMARRLVDAKAGGLASEIERLPSEIMEVPAADRYQALALALGRLVLMAEGYRNRSALPDPVAAELSRAIGWAVTRDDLLANPSALRKSSTWHPLASLSRRDAPTLRRDEQWMVCEQTGAAAVLVDYRPVRGKGKPKKAGGSAAPLAHSPFEGELVFYPSAAPIEALLGEGAHASDHSVLWSDPDTAPLPTRWSEALDTAIEILTAVPWRRAAPVLLGSATLLPSRGCLLIADASGEAVPLAPHAAELSRAGLLSIAGEAPFWLAALWDGTAAHPLAAGCQGAMWRGKGGKAIL